LISGRHLTFEPRLEEARWLASHFKVGAMIDLSDGLAGDLPHILRASGKGAELMGSAIPISASVAPGASDKGRPAMEAALSDGEDFELLFTLSAGEAVRLMDAWKVRFPETRLSCIGRVRDEPGVVLRDRAGERPLSLNGYVHFQKS
jgi:thiamine-monophosphate kinase